MTTFLPESHQFSGVTAHEARNRILARVERRIQEFIAEERREWAALNPDSTELIDCVARMVGSGGKRLRPAFCIAGYLAGGGDPDSQVVVDAAAALELLHTFALLHDDVMDDSELRRNEPTAHVLHSSLHERRDWRGEPRRYGESVAVLAGDLALVYAERLLADCPPHARRTWGDLCTELMIGQFLDVRAAARFDPDPELSSWIALFKSGRYTVYRPLAMGAELAGAGHLLDAFRTYGLALGEAFQLRDDLLDAFGSSESTGKPAQLDFKQHKMTLLMSFALRGNAEVSALVGDDLTAADPQELHDLLVRTGCRDDVEATIDERLRTAQTAVQGVLDPVWSAELCTMAHQAAHRDS
ncbi:polyprenyl synthetase family protein [Streptomyces sp. MUM 178J]|uniref:polyprenyl synthetase family protein n=1 Tax=Streptomyces sp. MUM 178J TaxID=2791991 RepID=UPI001F03BD4D|nr:polyprenyl synthetase family protein [Streptomyces sp. MUM 178J]WRQ80782.1 polyprenyl synthetase family protein [Streptomyces sp. MUM 178J]